MSNICIRYTELGVCGLSFLGHPDIGDKHPGECVSTSGITQLMVSYEEAACRFFASGKSYFRFLLPLYMDVDILEY